MQIGSNGYNWSQIMSQMYLTSPKYTSAWRKNNNYPMMYGTIFACLEQSEENPIRFSYDNSSYTYNRYAFAPNENKSPWSFLDTVAYYPFIKMKNPSRNLLLIEANSKCYNITQSWHISQSQRVDYRHGRQCNVLMSDTHVESTKYGANPKNLSLDGGQTVF
jgi:prepilin-type processing-associated H-X9-DG protein